MVFSAKTNGADEWKAIISAISTLVEEATFEATVEGISFRGMDPSHVALIDINWPNSAFEKYNCDSKEAVWWMLQTRSADEPTTQFYRCTKCKTTWRNYA